MSQITKKALASSLKKLSLNHPLDKITVTDIAEDCQVNRQTFYYHFQDIYDLVEWIYTSEVAVALGDKKTYDTWQQGFLQLFSYIQTNRAFVQNTYHSVNREYLERFLYKEAYNLLMDVIEEKSAGLSVRDNDKTFIAHFYKYGFVGLILDWIGTGMKEDPKEILGRLSVVIYGNIAEALERFSTGHL